MYYVHAAAGRLAQPRFRPKPRSGHGRLKCGLWRAERGALMTLRVSLVLPILFLFAASIAGATNLTGAWTFEWTPDFGGQQGNTHECQITQQGEAVTIHCDEQTMKGKVHGKTVTFEHTTGL